MDNHNKTIKVKNKVTVIVRTKKGKKAYYKSKNGKLIELKSKYTKGKLTIKISVEVSFVIRTALITK